MLRLLRMRSCCFVTAIVLAVGTTTATLEALLHTGTGHDAACVSSADAAHDAFGHRFQAPEDDASHDAHCVACHFARTPRAGAQSASFGDHVAEVRAPRPILAIGSARAAALKSLPPRSPPRLS